MDTTKKSSYMFPSNAKISEEDEPCQGLTLAS